MKRLFTLIFLLLGFLNVTLAQSFSVSTNEVWTIADPARADLEAHFEITNVTNAIQTIRWTRNVVDITNGCGSQVCDLNLCYLESVSTKTFDIDPNASGNIIMHFLNPNHTPGASAILDLKMSNENDPADSTIVTFLFTSSLSGTNELPVANVKLFPNPTVDNFQLTDAEDVARIRVFSMDNREVARFTATPGEIYSMESQPVGTYFLALEDEKGQVFQAIRLVKQ